MPNQPQLRERLAEALRPIWNESDADQWLHPSVLYRLADRLLSIPGIAIVDKTLIGQLQRAIDHYRESFPGDEAASGYLLECADDILAAAVKAEETTND